MDQNTQKSASVIAQDAELTGEMTFSDAMNIQGKFDGKINSETGTLAIGSKAEVKADIKAKNLTIEGKVNGMISVKDKVTLKAHSAVHGDLNAARIVTEDLCVLVGKCSIGDK